MLVVIIKHDVRVAGIDKIGMKMYNDGEGGSDLRREANTGCIWGLVGESFSFEGNE